MSFTHVAKLSPNSSFSWAELALFSFNPDKPMGRTDKPMGRTDKPMGRADKPMGRADKPMGRTDKPMGRQPGKVFFQCQDKLGNVRLR